MAEHGPAGPERTNVLPWQSQVCGLRSPLRLVGDVDPPKRTSLRAGERAAGKTGQDRTGVVRLDLPRRARGVWFLCLAHPNSSSTRPPRGTQSAHTPA